MARSVLFSQQDLADEMADRFECCWVSMGRVPFATGERSTYSQDCSTCLPIVQRCAALPRIIDP